MIRHNATSMWERWDGWTEENGFAYPGSISFNHYSLGSVGRWFFQYMGGIDTDDDEIGFKKIIIKPHIGLGVNEVSTSYESVRGVIKSNWKLVNKIFDIWVSPNVGFDFSFTYRLF